MTNQTVVTYRVLYPERRTVTAGTLISWAKDDIANGESFVFDSPDEVVTVEDALAVLDDSGTVTVAV